MDSEPYRMKVEKIYTDKSWHPPRRRVKYFPITQAKSPEGNQVVIDNSAMVGEYPILWARKVGLGEVLIVMLMDERTGITAHGRLAESDYEKLPETDIEW